MKIKISLIAIVSILFQYAICTEVPQEQLKMENDIKWGIDLYNAKKYAEAIKIIEESVDYPCDINLKIKGNLALGIMYYHRKSHLEENDKKKFLNELGKSKFCLELAIEYYKYKQKHKVKSMHFDDIDLNYAQALTFLTHIYITEFFNKYNNLSYLNIKDKEEYRNVEKTYKLIEEAINNPNVCQQDITFFRNKKEIMPTKIRKAYI